MVAYFGCVKALYACRGSHIVFACIAPVVYSLAVASSGEVGSVGSAEAKATGWPVANWPMPESTQLSRAKGARRARWSRRESDTEVRLTLPSSNRTCRFPASRSPENARPGHAQATARDCLLRPFSETTGRPS
jgi:hypothetical protein